MGIGCVTQPLDDLAMRRSPTNVCWTPSSSRTLLKAVAELLLHHGTHVFEDFSSWFTLEQFVTVRVHCLTVNIFISPCDSHWAQSTGDILLHTFQVCWCNLHLHLNVSDGIVPSQVFRWRADCGSLLALERKRRWRQIFLKMKEDWLLKLKHLTKNLAKWKKNGVTSM